MGAHIGALGSVAEVCGQGGGLPPLVGAAPAVALQVGPAQRRGTSCQERQAPTMGVPQGVLCELQQGVLSEVQQEALCELHPGVLCELQPGVLCELL